MTTESVLIAEGGVTRPPSGREVDGNLFANFQTEGASAYTVYPYKIKRYWLLILNGNVSKRFEISLCCKEKTNFIIRCSRHNFWLSNCSLSAVSFHRKRSPSLPDGGLDTTAFGG